MTVAELNAYIKRLRTELSWRPKTSYAYKAVSKRIEVAEKVRDVQRGREVAGDV